MQFRFVGGTYAPRTTLGAIRQEHTVLGQFVDDVLKANLPFDEERRILITGLRALHSRGDLDVF